jgi:hypothetical protein
MGEERSPKNQARLAKWVRFLGVVFRILILGGLALLIFMIGLVLLSDFLQWWMLGFPLLIVGIGVLLARIEYWLYRRL